jgi:hypothetical protein
MVTTGLSLGWHCEVFIVREVASGGYGSAGKSCTLPCALSSAARGNISVPPYGTWLQRRSYWAWFAGSAEVPAGHTRQAGRS